MKALEFRNIAKCPKCNKTFETNHIVIQCNCFMRTDGDFSMNKVMMVITPKVAEVADVPKNTKPKGARSTKTKEMFRVETKTGNIFFYEHELFINGEFHSKTWTKEDGREDCVLGKSYFQYPEFRLLKGAFQRTRRKFKNN